MALRRRSLRPGRRGLTLGPTVSYPDAGYQRYLVAGDDGFYLISWPEEYLDRPEPQGRTTALLHLDQDASLLSVTTPWVHGIGLDAVSLAGGSPATAWGWRDELTVSAWELAGGAAVQRRSVVRRRGHVAASAGLVLQGYSDEAGVKLERWDPQLGAVNDVMLPEDLASLSTLRSIQATDQGWLVVLSGSRRATALWLGFDGQELERQTLPGTWGLNKLTPLGDGLVGTFSLDTAPFVEFGPVHGLAHWSRQTGWRVTVPSCSAPWIGLAVSGDVALVGWAHGGVPELAVVQAP